MKYKCKICQGTYSDVCADGLKYYHECPTTTNEEGETVERVGKRNENIIRKQEDLGREII